MKRGRMEGARKGGGGGGRVIEVKGPVTKDD